MKWTKDKPTVPGWYWYRGEDAGTDKPVAILVENNGYAVHKPGLR